MQKKVIDIFSPKEIKKEVKPFFFAEKKIEEEKEEFKAEKGKKNHLAKILIFFSFILIVSIAFLNFVFLKVTVEIFPETESLLLNEKINVLSNIDRFDLSSKALPGKIFEVEKSGSQKFNTIGKAMKEDYAQGVIRVYNNSNNPQTLIKNTRFQPALEKVIYFRSLKTVVVPAKGYVDVEVKADKPGEEYNIEPTNFSVPGLTGLPQYYSIYGKSFSPITGGAKGLISQVSQEDLDLAQKQLSETLIKEAKEYLQKESGENFIFLNEAVSENIIFATSSVPVGIQKDEFEFNKKVKLKILTFNRNDLNSFFKEFIQTKIESVNKKLKEKSLKIEYSVLEVKDPLDKMVLEVKISADIYSAFDETSLKKALMGKSIKEGQALLNNDRGIKKAKVKVFPFWLQKIPLNEKKINFYFNID